MSEWNELPASNSLIDFSAENNNNNSRVTAGPSPIKSSPIARSETKKIGFFNKFNFNNNRPGSSSSLDNWPEEYSSESQVDQDKILPGYLMANRGIEVFDMIYKLGNLGDIRIVEAARRLLYVIPTQPELVQKFDMVMSNITEDQVKPGGIEVPPERGRESITLTTSKDMLRQLFDTSHADMTQFKLLYHLEVLTARMVTIGPKGPSINSRFCREFFHWDGIKILLQLLATFGQRPDSESHVVPPDAASIYLQKEIRYRLIDLMR